MNQGNRMKRKSNENKETVDCSNEGVRYCDSKTAAVKDLRKSLFCKGVDLELHEIKKFAILKYNGNSTEIKINTSIITFLRIFLMITDDYIVNYGFVCWENEDFYRFFMSKKSWTFDEFNNKEELLNFVKGSIFLIHDSDKLVSLDEIKEIENVILKEKLNGNQDRFFHQIFMESPKPYPHGYIFYGE